MICVVGWLCCVVRSGVCGGLDCGWWVWFCKFAFSCYFVLMVDVLCGLGLGCCVVVVLDVA